MAPSSSSSRYCILIRLLLNVRKQRRLRRKRDRPMTKQPKVGRLAPACLFFSSDEVIRDVHPSPGRNSIRSKLIDSSFFSSNLPWVSCCSRSILLTFGTPMSIQWRCSGSLRSFLLLLDSRHWRVHVLGWISLRNHLRVDGLNIVGV